jgi:autonomous glycyl radical cofactor GrcA
MKLALKRCAEEQQRAHNVNLVVVDGQMKHRRVDIVLKLAMRSNGGQVLNETYLQSKG